MQKKDFAFGGFQLGRVSGKPNLTFGYPILDKTGPDKTGDVRAVIGVGVRSDYLNQTMATTELPDYAALTVVDEAGTVVVRYPASEQYIGQKLLDHPFIQTVLRQKEGVAELAGLDNVNRLYAFTAFGGADKPDFYVVMGISPAHIYAGVNRTLGSSLLGLGVIGLAAHRCLD